MKWNEINYSTVNDKMRVHVKRIKLMYAGQLMHRVNDSITCIYNILCVECIVLMYVKGLRQNKMDSFN